MMTIAEGPLTYRGTSLSLLPAAAGAIASVAYPFIWGPFALALTLLATLVMVAVAVVGLAASRWIVRPLVLRSGSLLPARWRAALVLGSTAVVISVAFVLAAVLGSNTADGSPQWALIAPVSLAIGVALLVYLAALGVVTPRSVTGPAMAQPPEGNR